MKKLLLIALTITPLVLHALPKIPDELANYRGQCNSEQAQALVGKSHLTENQILNCEITSINKRKKHFVLKLNLENEKYNV